MEQKRLGLIGKAMLVVPGHCLAQVSREFLQLYPTARILVADETNFVKAKRSRFLARAATANWDAVIITHAAFRFIPVPAAFEREMIREQLAACEALALRADNDDRITRKRIEAMKEKLGEKLAALRGRRDDMVTLEEIGIDQIIVDEAQEFRKLSFATNQVNLKGVDPDGSQRAWDLFVKARYLDRKRPGRALIQASGTPITNSWEKCTRCCGSRRRRRCASAACTNSTPGPRLSATRRPNSNCSRAAPTSRCPGSPPSSMSPT
jgi:N12 class adenine-specific DNA methylase